MLGLLNLAYRAYEMATGVPIRMYEVVRNYAQLHRRERCPSPRRNLRRVARAAPDNLFPIPVPLPSQPVNGPLVDRKRKASDVGLPMIRAKRHDNGAHKSSPWNNEVWLQHHSKDLHSELPQPQQEQSQPEYHSRTGRVEKWEQRKAQRINNRPHPYTRNGLFSSMASRSNRVSLVNPRPARWDLIYASPERSQTPEFVLALETVPVTDEAIHMNIDDGDLDGTDFSPKKSNEPAPGREPEPVQEEQYADQSQETEETQKKEDDDAWLWDEEGNVEERKVLRALPESVDDDGYKVAIDGWISPETQAWNEEHRRKLLREAAHAQQTPSKPPKYRAPSVSSYHSEDEHSSQQGQDQNDSTTLLEDVVQDISAKRRDQDEANGLVYNKVWGRKAKTTTPTIKREIPAGGSSVVKEEDSPTGSAIMKEECCLPRVKEEENTPQAKNPLAEIENLSIKAKDPRTPKARAFEAFKTERITRTQRVKAEREAQKSSYPIVDLSKDWENKVRHAVNHGHGRFEAKMFNKCVPEFSNDPSAGSLWLDDAVINDYIAMVAKHGSKDDRPTQVRSVAALSSFFYTKISTPSPDFNSCNRMVKRAGIQGKNLLECEKVFIPINRSYHWTLAVIEPKVPEGQDPTEHKRKLTIYNSMGTSGGQQVAGYIFRWIQHELGSSFKPEEWEVDPAGGSPQQSNSDDCGVFTVTTARQIMLGKYAPNMYPSSIIRTQRRRIVAELVNQGLLNKEDSES